MRQRWCVAGLLRAESKFRRVNGYRYLPQLFTALERLVQTNQLDPQTKGLDQKSKPLDKKAQSKGLDQTRNAA